ncbi:MAG: YhcH/YjgK/YiaL family protein [Bacteroidales bacterium]|nr:YhcH/YjgK/YiaL family protein [Bacteroidales bacterium]
MIVDSLFSFDKYVSMHAGFDKVQDFIKKNDLRSLEPGRHDIDGDTVYCDVYRGKLMGMQSRPMEVHDSYIDIHLLLDGSETIGVKDRRLCETSKCEYDQLHDAAFIDEAPENYVSPGIENMVILFPADAHVALMGDEKEEVSKIVFKVKVNSEEKRMR